MNRDYEIYGPFEIPRLHGIVDRKGLKENFWAHVHSLDEKLGTAKGVYVLSLRAGKGIRPWYIGKACGAKGFEQEIFTDRNQRIYAEILTSKKGTPLIYLIARKTKSGRFGALDDREAVWVENFIISLAIEANPELANKRGTSFLKECSIPGVLNNSKPGKATGATLDLKRVLNLI